MQTSGVAGLWLTPLLVLGLACSDSGSSELAGPVLSEETVLLSVTPVGGSTDVDPNQPVVIQFSYAMAAGMEAYAALHEGDLNGPAVEGEWTWSDDRTRLTFTPAAALKPATAYVIHLGGGMRDSEGDLVDFERHGPGMGGEWATQEIMDGSGGMTPGGFSHMGDGWQHPNGSYGMIFTFTTRG